VGAGLFLGLHVRSLIDMAERVEREGWPKIPPMLWPVFATIPP
jgi:hypothetical protein